MCYFTQTKYNLNQVETSLIKFIRNGGVIFSYYNLIMALFSGYSPIHLNHVSILPPVLSHRRKLLNFELI